MASSTRLNELQRVLESLEKFELPSNIQDLGVHDAETARALGAASPDPSLLERYQQARDEYLKRRMMQAFFEYVETCQTDENGQPNFELPPDVLSEEQHSALLERQHRALSDIQASVRKIQDSKAELQAQYAAFASKRQDVQQMVREMELSRHMQEDDDEEEQGNNSDIDEEAMIEEEERLIALQQRRAALEAEILTVENENMRVQKSLKLGKAELDEMVAQEASLTGAEVSPQAIASLREENAKMESELRRLKEIHEFHDSLVMILEELSGVRILSVDEVPEMERSDKQEELSLTVLVSDGHKIRFDLKVDETRKRAQESFQVVNAEFLTPTLIEGPLRKEKGVSTVQLRIPDLSDLIELADSLAPGDNLRFILREAAARVRFLHARVLELAELQTEVPTKIYPIKTNGGESQMVICSLDEEQVTVVLSLFPDCPVMKGSVSIAELVGIGGWDNSVITDIQERVNAQGNFCRPRDVIRAVKAEIKRRQEQEGLTLPHMPTMPERRAL